ncbi:MAG TPA: cytochrome P450, partial [Abditibacteriaceae bacterium]
LKNNANYKKCTPYKLLNVVFGGGLLFSEGELHRKQRRLMQPSFQPRYFEQFNEGVRGIISSTLDDWHRRPDGQKVDIEEEMSELSRRINGFTLFGNDAPPEINKILNSRVGKLGLLLGTLPLSPQTLYFRHVIRKLDKAIYAAIEKRRNAPPDAPADMVTTLMNTKYKDSDECMSDRQLRDEIVTLLVSGFDTTARTLTWAFHVMNEHPEIEQKFRAELDEVLGGRMPSFDDLPKLVYTTKMIQETMRMFPPNPTIGRVAVEDDEIDGHHIPAGSVMTLSPYLAHRNARHWPNPEVFDPERFAPENMEGRHRFAYCPFGGGARQCIGKGIALMTIPLSIASIAQHYSVRALPNAREMEYDIKVTFRSRRRMFMTHHQLQTH